MPYAINIAPERTKVEIFRFLKTKFGYVLRWVGSLALIGLIISYLDFGNILEIGEKIKPEFILLALCMLFLERVVISARWPFLLRIKGHQVSFWDAFKIDWISSFFSMALPSMATFDAVRGYRLFRLTDDLKTSFSCIVFDRAIGSLTLAFTGVLSLFLAWNTFGPRPALIGLGAFAFVAFAGIFFTASTRITEIPESLFPFLRKNKIWKYLLQLHNDFLLYRANKSSILIVLMLSLATQAMRILVVCTVALSLNSTLPFFYFVLFIPIVFTIKMLPISIGGIGAREATFAVLYSWAGMPGEEGIILGLTISLLTLLYSVFGGFVYLTYRSPKRDITKEDMDYPLEVKRSVDP